MGPAGTGLSAVQDQQSQRLTTVCDDLCHCRRHSLSSEALSRSSTSPKVGSGLGGIAILFKMFHSTMGSGLGGIAILFKMFHSTMPFWFLRSHSSKRSIAFANCAQTQLLPS